jgi:hypothetical protein
MSSPTSSDSAPTTASTAGDAPRTSLGAMVHDLAVGLRSSRIIRPMIIRPPHA